MQHNLTLNAEIYSIEGAVTRGGDVIVLRSACKLRTTKHAHEHVSATL